METWKIDITRNRDEQSDGTTTISYSKQPPRVPRKVSHHRVQTRAGDTQAIQEETRAQLSGPGRTRRDNDYNVCIGHGKDRARRKTALQNAFSLSCSVSGPATAMKRDPSDAGLPLNKQKHRE